MDRTVREVALIFGAVHFVCGCLVLIEPAVIKISSLAIFNAIFAGQTFIPALFLIGFGAMAIAGSRKGVATGERLFLIGPQQIILILQVLSISNALATGVFPDGYVPVGRGFFILGDQLLVLAAGAAHTSMYLIELTKALGFPPREGPQI